MLFILTLIFLSIGSRGWASEYSYPLQSNSTQCTNYTVSSSPVTILALDQSRVNWRVHPDGTSPNIRCEWSNLNGTFGTTPTSTVGYEYTAGVEYQAYPSINPSLSVECISESGSVSVSVCTDEK